MTEWGGRGGDSKTNLDFRSADPTDGWESVLVKQVVCLVVESPLADGEGGARILHLLHHVCKGLGLVLAELFEIFAAGNIKLVRGLWLWWFKWARQDGNLGVCDRLLHLWVGHVFVEQHALYQHSILQLPSNLPIHLNQLKIYIFRLHVGDLQHCVHRNLRKLFVAPVHTAVGKVGKVGGWGWVGEDQRREQVRDDNSRQAALYYRKANTPLSRSLSLSSLSPLSWPYETPWMRVRVRVRVRVQMCVCKCAGPSHAGTKRPERHVKHVARRV